MRNIITETDLFSVVALVTRCNEACKDASGCSIVSKGYIIAWRASLWCSIRAVSNASLLIDCHVDKFDTTTTNITDEVSCQSAIPELIQVPADRSPSDEHAVDDLNIVAVPDDQTPVETLMHS